MLNEFISDLLVIHLNETDELTVKYKKLRLLLNRYVLLKTKEDGVVYPNTSSRLESLMKRCELASVHRFRINAFRIKTNKLRSEKPELSQEEYTWELYALYSLMQRLEGVENERQLFESLFHLALPQIKYQAEDRNYEVTGAKHIIPVRMIEPDAEDQLLIYVHREDHVADKMAIRIKEDCSYLRELEADTYLNLIFLSQNKEKENTPDIIVVEPNYLIDISAIAECFKPYGHDELNYLFSRLTPAENTRHILLGNVANAFLDEIVNEIADAPIEYLDAMRKVFRNSPFEFSTCEDLNDPSAERVFFQETKQQFDQIAKIVREDFLNPNYGIDRTKAILEPSFLCQALGLQGRLDLMLDDYSKFIELKSGKANDIQGRLAHRENHFVQMMLYFAVLTFNTTANAQDIQAFLMYSKHGLLYPEKPYWALVRESIQLRNKIVMTEYLVNRANSAEYTGTLLDQITPDRLNRQQLSGRFWDVYLRPGIDNFAEKIAQLSEEERLYFLRVYTFITKELYISKVGGSASHDSNRGISMLWDALHEEKVDAGEILYDLILEESVIEENVHSVRFRIPKYEEDLLPNFRVGDVVILYTRNYEFANVTNRQILKASVTEISDSHLVLHLRMVQRHANLFDEKNKYAIEHDFMDVGYTSMFRGLAAYLHARPDRRQMLLHGSGYQQNSIVELPDIADDLDRIVAKVKQAKDYFLLVGPPGTGKTSQALRRMVDEYYYRSDENILLLSFTNRAVDEICQMLETFGEEFEYVRISSESACEERFKPHLLDQFLQECSNRREVKNKLERCRVYVGTVSSLSSKTELFALKRFGIAMLDEATQLLEPQLLTLLCAKDKYGANAIAKFVLIGDHKQLPAVLLQTEEESEVRESVLRALGINNLKDSLFERLYRKALFEENDAQMDMLVKTGRMHPELAAFPNEFFYESKLMPIPLPHQREELPFLRDHSDELLNTLASARIAFFDTGNVRDLSSVKTSRNEAVKIAEILKGLQSLYNEIGQPFDLSKEVGIITPYRSQIALIRKALLEQGFQRVDEVMIDTVERFQGSQRNVIIYSFCINRFYQFSFLCNTIEENGFLIDRKLNVAMTRARKQLFLVGNKELILRNKLYASLIGSIRHQIEKGESKIE
ncbi:MAG: DEAD/DEAH box helicase [Bacteroidales bacterium]